MTTQEMLESAARALGLIYRFEGGESFRIDEADDADVKSPWNPLHDQADSDRMGCDLEIEVKFVAALGATERNYIYASSRRSHKLSPDIEHDNTVEGRRAAVREARMLAAVEIGRGK